MVLLLPALAPLWIWLILTWCCWNLPSLCSLCGQITKVSFTYQTQKRGLSSAWSMARDSKCSMYIIGYYQWQGWTHGCPCDLLVWLPFPLQVLDVKHNPINWNTVCCDGVVQSSGLLSALNFAATTCMASSTGIRVNKHHEVRVLKFSSPNPLHEMSYVRSYFKLRLSTVKVSTAVNANPLVVPMGTRNTKRSRPSLPPATEAHLQDVSVGSISST